MFVGTNKLEIDSDVESNQTIVANTILKEQKYVLMTSKNLNVDYDADVGSIKEELKTHILNNNKLLKIDICVKDAFSTNMIYSFDSFFNELVWLESDEEIMDLKNNLKIDSIVDFRLVTSPNKRMYDTRALGIDMFTSKYSDLTHIPEIVKPIHNGAGLKSTDDIHITKNNLLDFSSEITAYYEDVYRDTIKSYAGIDKKEERRIKTKIEEDLNPYFTLKKSILGGGRLKEMTPDALYGELQTVLGVDEYQIILPELPNEKNIKREIAKFLNTKYSEINKEIKDELSIQTNKKIKHLIDTYAKNNEHKLMPLIEERNWVLGSITNAIDRFSDSGTLAEFQHIYQEELFKTRLENVYGHKLNRVSLFEYKSTDAKTHADEHKNNEIDLLLSHIFVNDCGCQMHEQEYSKWYIANDNDEELKGSFVNYLVLVPIKSSDCSSCREYKLLSVS